jgi:hypothetical protein
MNTIPHVPVFPRTTEAAKAMVFRRFAYTKDRQQVLMAAYLAAAKTDTEAEFNRIYCAHAYALTRG